MGKNKFLISIVLIFSIFLVSCANDSNIENIPYKKDIDKLYNNIGESNYNKIDTTNYINFSIPADLYLKSVPYMQYFEISVRYFNEEGLDKDEKIMYGEVLRQPVILDYKELFSIYGEYHNNIVIMASGNTVDNIGDLGLDIESLIENKDSKYTIELLNTDGNKSIYYLDFPYKTETADLLLKGYLSIVKDDEYIGYLIVVTEQYEDWMLDVIKSLELKPGVLGTGKSLEDDDIEDIVK